MPNARRGIFSGSIDMSNDAASLLVHEPCAVSSEGFNLLRLSAIRRIILSRAFPYAIQAGLLLTFVGLILLGCGSFAPSGVPDKLFAKTNLVTLVIWGLWWPAMVWVAVLFGRAWCMICPLELVSNVGERIGRVLGLRQINLPRWAAAGWLILAVYALIQVLVAGAHIHRIPHYTADFLIGLLITATVTGLLIRHRAFCRGFCPVGLLLGTYGRGGMLAVRAAGAKKCIECDERHCLHKNNRTKLDGRSCPSLLNPPKLNGSRDCLVCGQCIKACRPDNMQLLFRPPFSKHDAREPLATWPVTLFVMLVSGFVTYELCSEWPAAKEVFLVVPGWAAEHLGGVLPGGYIKGVWTLLVWPVLLWLTLGSMVRVFRGAGSLGEAWRRLALPAAVVVASGHMAKGLAKFASWSGFLPYAMQDLDGRTTVESITAGTLPVPRTLMGEATTSILGMELVALGLCLAIREVWLTDSRRCRWPVILSLFGLASLFLFLTYSWGGRSL